MKTLDLVTAVLRGSVIQIRENDTWGMYTVNKTLSLTELEALTGHLELRVAPKGVVLLLNQLDKIKTELRELNNYSL